MPACSSSRWAFHSRLAWCSACSLRSRPRRLICRGAAQGVGIGEPSAVSSSSCSGSLRDLPCFSQLSALMGVMSYAVADRTPRDWHACRARRNAVKRDPTRAVRDHVADARGFRHRLFRRAWTDPVHDLTAVRGHDHRCADLRRRVVRPRGDRARCRLRACAASTTMEKSFFVALSSEGYASQTRASARLRPEQGSSTKAFFSCLLRLCGAALDLAVVDRVEKPVALRSLTTCVTRSRTACSASARDDAGESNQCRERQRAGMARPDVVMCSPCGVFDRARDRASTEPTLSSTRRHSQRRIL